MRIPIKNTRINVLIGGVDFTLNIILLGILVTLVVSSIFVTVLLLLNSLSWLYVLTISVPVSAIVIFFMVRVYKKYQTILLPDKYRIERIICIVLLVLGIVVWGLFNMKYSSEHVFLNRDPGVYTLGALHLSKSDDIEISAMNQFGGGTSVVSSAVGQSEIDDDELYFQGLHLLPALVGLGGKLVGAENVFHLNVIFGMTALVSIFVFAGKIVRPFWALVAALIMSVSMPLLYFSRDMYTEPLAATFTFTGLSFLWLATQTRARELWFLSGLAVGAAALTRIDGYIAIAATLVFIAFYVAFGIKNQKLLRIREAVLFIVGAAITGLLGWLDLFFLSSGYFFDLYSNFISEMIAIAAGLAGIILLCVIKWKTSFFELIQKRFKKYYAAMIVFAALFAVIALGTRQFWDETYNHFGRNYNELAPLWPSWYIGDLLVALGVIGAAISLYNVVVHRKIAYLIPFSVIGLTSALYLIKPSISPDQVWASRRLLPVILPGIVIFAMIVVEKITDLTTKKLNIRTGWAYVLSCLIALVLTISPLTVSKPMVFHAQYTQLSILDGFCANLPTDSGIVWLGKGAEWAVQVTEEVCGLPAVGLLNSNVNQSNLKIIEKNILELNRVPVIAIFGSDLMPSAQILQARDYKEVVSADDRDIFQLASSGEFKLLESPVDRVPKTMLSTQMSIWTASLDNGDFVRLDEDIE